MGCNILKTEGLILFFSLFAITLFSQTFTEKVGISFPGASSGPVTWGDYDNDGDLDIFTDSVVYRNDEGNFTATNAVFPDYERHLVDLGDYDCDGDMDILTSNGILRNDSGSFTEVFIDVPWNYESTPIAWGDYDNDGDLDRIDIGNYYWEDCYLVMGGIEQCDGWEAPYLVVYQNDNGRFVLGAANEIADYIGKASWGDYDNDGDLDLLTGFNILQNENGTFKQFVTGMQILFDGSCEFGDYDSDGDLDILMTGFDTYSRTNPVTKIYRNDNGNFTAIISDITGVSVSTATWGDFDNDGDLDILVAGRAKDLKHITRVYRNDAGTFRKLDENFKSFDNCSASWGDFDNDGDLDILLSDAVYRNNSADANSVPSAPSNLKSDFHRTEATLQWDKSNDSQTPQNGLSYNIYFGTAPAAENIRSSMASLPGGYRRIVRKGDIQVNKWKIEGVGAGTYYWSVQAIDNCFAGSGFAEEQTLVIPFLNSMGPVDVQTIGINQTGSELSVIESSIPISRQWKYSTQNGGPYDMEIEGATGTKYSPLFLTDGTFYVVCVSVYNSVEYISNEVVINVKIFTEDVSVKLPGIFESSADWGDFDNDGDLDLLLTGDGGNNNISRIYRNVNNVFYDIDAGLTGVRNPSADWGDFDNDGDLDILLTGNSDFNGYVSIVYRNDYGIFTDIGADLLKKRYNSADWGDYDNDGDLDILLSGIIYRNISGHFSDINAGLPDVNGSVEWGDYDNDGDLDILLVGLSNYGSISRIYNNEKGTFTDIEADLTMVSGYAAWGDYDSDGDLDLAITGYVDISNSITKVYRNDSGKFTDINANLTGTIISGMVSWGDFDNDSDLDILLTGNPNLSILYRNDNGVFSDIDAGLTRISNGYSSWADYDNDGDLDILLSGKTSYDSCVSKVIRNNLTDQNTVPSAPTNLQSQSGKSDRIILKWDDSTDHQTSQQGLTYNLYIGTEASSADIKSPMASIPDGYRRIVKKGDIQDTHWYIKGIPAGKYYWSVQAIDNIFAGSMFSVESTFEVKFFSSVTPDSVQVLTINQNGIKLSVTESENPESRQWKYSTESGGPYINVIAGATGSTIIPNFPDFGTYYVVCESTYKSVAYVTNEILIDVTRHIFSEQTEIKLTGICNGDVAWGDFDNDNDLDILLAGETGCGAVSKIYRNNKGAYNEIEAGLTGVSNGSVDWGDFDNDGDLDILLTGITDDNQNISKIYRNETGTFNDIKADLAGVTNSDGSWGDFDNDGDLDIVVTGSADNWNCITKVYRNEQGVFNDINAELPGITNSSAAWGDYDNDGDLDLLLSGREADEYQFNTFTGIYRNNEGEFGNICADLPHAPIGSAVWGDYDNDGDLDILMSGMRDYFSTISRIYENKDGVFYEKLVRLEGGTNPSSRWGDFDNDGDLDILLTGLNSNSEEVMLIYRNDKNIFTDINADLIRVEGSSAAWGDFDNDGDLDILVTGYSFDNTDHFISIIYRNNITRANTVPDAPSDLRSKIIGSDVLLSWNRSNDSNMGKNGLSYNLYITSNYGTTFDRTPMASIIDGSFRLAQKGAIQDTAWIIKNLPNGFYYWSVQAIDNTFAGGKWAVETLFIFQNPVSVNNDSSNSSDIVVYPNPTSRSFEMNINSNATGNAKIILYNSYGERVLEYQTEKPNPDLNCNILVTGLPSGIYLIEVSVDEKKISYARIIIIK